jgi:hypothetical protein
VNIFGHFNEELMREDIFELTISCEDINKINDGNGFRVVNFITSKSSNCHE